MIQMRYLLIQLPDHIVAAQYLCRIFLLYDNTDQTTLAVIDDFLHGILKLYLAFFTDGRYLASDTILHELFNRFPENIGLPDAFTALAAFINILHQILCLLFCSYDRSNFGFYIGFDHMDRRAF